MGLVLCLAVSFLGLSACSSTSVKVQQSKDPAFLMQILTTEKAEWLVDDAARGLGRISHAAAIPALIAIVSDPNAGHRRRAGAAWALGQMKDLKAVVPLASALDRASDPEERFAIVEALGRIPNAEAKAALEAMKNDSDEMVAKAARKGLKTIGEVAP